MAGWEGWGEEEARRIRSLDRWRSVRDLDGPGPATVAGERAIVSFASNDYLGLTTHPAVVAAARDAAERWGAGAGSARLVAGARPVHRALEEELADWKGTEAAVLFPTGYAANVGVLQALGGPSVTVVSDELNHASIVDGCRLSRSDVVVTPHCDVEAVARAVAGAAGRAVVVTESVFSMDGHVAPLAGLAAVCAGAGALLVVDDAHAVLTPAEPAPILMAEPHAPARDPAISVDGGGPVIVRVGTLSKMLGSLGGFVAGPAWLCQLVVNKARTFVFTTASTPADTAAALAALRVVRSAEGSALRHRLRALIERFRPGHPTPIVPVVVGGESETLAAAAALMDQGLLVPAIRPPTVPAGTSRLRVSLTAAHTPAQVDRLRAALDELGLDARRTPAPAAAARNPGRLVLVLGTGTGVGKTWVAAGLAGALRAAGTTVAARKPAQSFDAGEDPAVTDAGLLGAATGEDRYAVCPEHRWYPLAMAPPMAAEALGRAPFTVSDLVAELRWPAGIDVGLVEGAGGPRSPLAADGDNVALARAVRSDIVVVLVADAGLGTLNATLLSVDALPRRPVVFLNRYDAGDPVHAANVEWLQKRAGLSVVTTLDDLATTVLE